MELQLSYLIIVDQMPHMVSQSRYRPEFPKSVFIRTGTTKSPYRCMLFRWDSMALQMSGTYVLLRDRD